MLLCYIYCVFISFNICFAGILGCIMIKRNLILILICIEVILISIQLNFILASYNHNDIIGQIFVLFILMVAAAEIAIGLALLIINYRLRGTIETKFIYLSKG